MDKTKIQLSAEEAALVSKADWILTKNQIIRKAQLLMATVQEDQLHLISSFDSFPEIITQSSPKISKGENYKGLPYVILDYPRVFGRKDVFAIRTFFWWGNFFSVTLHLSGAYQKMYGENITRSLEFLQKAGFFICINEDEWEHHFEAGNYQSLEQFTPSSLNALIGEKTFIKLSKKIPLQQWNDAGKILLEIFGQLAAVLKH